MITATGTQLTFHIGGTSVGVSNYIAAVMDTIFEIPDLYENVEKRSSLLSLVHFPGVSNRQKLKSHRKHLSPHFYHQ